jgi:ABC-type glycerol-3-phosphate transport system substrate-binding protein
MKKLALLMASLLLLTGCAQSATENSDDKTSVKIYFVADTPRGL